MANAADILAGMWSHSRYRRIEDPRVVARHFGIEDRQQGTSHVTFRCGLGMPSVPAEAIANGRDALKSVLLTMTEFGDPIPNPAGIANSSGQWRHRIPKSPHARLVNRAAREGVSLSTLVTAMIVEGLGIRKQAR